MARRQKSDNARRDGIPVPGSLPSKYGHFTGHRYNVGLQT